MSSFIYVEFEDNDPLKTKESTILFLWGNYSNLAPSEKTVFLSPSLNQGALNFCPQLTSS
jgi:hypothetical protein